MYKPDEIDYAYDRMQEERMLEKREMNENSLNTLPVEDFVFSDLQYVDTEESLGRYDELVEDTNLESQMEEARCQ